MLTRFEQVGCGTAVPTCALFARLLNEIAKKPTEPDSPRPPRTRIHVQDYNKQGAWSIDARLEDNKLTSDKLNQF